MAGRRPESFPIRRPARLRSFRRFNARSLPPSDLSALPRHATLITMLQCGSIYSHTPSPLKALSFLIFLLVLLPGSLRCEPAPGIAMHGKPAEPPCFTHFPYANPDAPKGGRLTLAKRGSFDSLNPLIVKGESACSPALTTSRSRSMA